jgi:zinc transporter ZupT
MNGRPGGDGQARPAGTGSRAGLTAHDRRRLRATYRTALAGVVLGVLGAAAVGMLGASGRAGVAVLLVVSAAGCMAAAFVTAVLAMIDEYRHVAVGRPRTLAALWFFLGSAMLLVMSTGVGAA